MTRRHGKPWLRRVSRLLAAVVAFEAASVAAQVPVAQVPVAQVPVAQVPVAQAPAAPLPNTDVPPLSISARTPLDAFRDGRRDIELTLSRPLGADDGALVVLAGTMDVSALSQVNGTTLTISPKAFPLPSGESQLIVLRKAGGHWTPLATLPLRILQAGGFTRESVVPTISLNSSGEVADGHSSGVPAAPHNHRQDVTLGAAMRSTHERPNVALESQSNVVGATREQLALRFSQRGKDAPLVDLSNYLVSLSLPHSKLDVGHVSLGANRHLVSGVSSRGVSLTAGPSWAQVTLGSVAGAPIVGWDNVLGVAESKHRVSTASLGLELLRKRPGALQVRVTALDGSLLPRPGFTQGAVTDAEESRGAGVELTAASPGQRARLSAGYTRSTFDNPARDPQLTGGLTVRKSVKDRRGARYAEGTLALVQGKKLFKRLLTQLSVGVRHERVDPLYRSVGAGTQSDREQNAVDLNGSVGALTVQGGVTRGRDNLAAIPSVLTSHTNGYTANSSFGVAPLLGIKRHASLLPQVTLGYVSSHQFAIGAPASNDFRPKDLANQVNTSADASTQWQLRQWRVALRGNLTHQDNRQPTREKADFSGNTENASVGRSFGTRVDASLDAGLERQRNEELSQVNRVRRIGVTTNWRAARLTTLSANLTAAVSRTPPATHDVTNMEMRFELAQSVRLFGRGTDARMGQGFLRFARTSVTDVPFSFTTTGPPPSLTTRIQWSLNTGLSLRLW